MPQPVTDSPLSPARPVEGGQDVSEQGVGLGPPPTVITYELWVQHDADGKPVTGWLEVYGEPSDTPIRIPQTALPAFERLAQQYFGESIIESEIGIDVRDGDLAVALRQEWGMGLVFGFLIACFAVGTAVVMTVRSRRQATLFRTIARHEMVSREAERTRVAREIHDGPLQDIAALARQANGEGGPLRSVAAELRALAAGLRPPALDEFGLAAALEDLAERHGAATPPLAVRVRTDLAPGQRLTDDVELALYRVAQEALTNAVSHGRARTAWVFVRPDGDTVHLEIRDDGVGLKNGAIPDDTSSLVSAGHFGLAGMTERARALDGTLTLSPGPRGVGVAVQLSVPATSLATHRST